MWKTGQRAENEAAHQIKDLELKSDGELKCAVSYGLANQSGQRLTPALQFLLELHCEARLARHIFSLHAAGSQIGIQRQPRLCLHRLLAQYRHFCGQLAQFVSLRPSAIFTLGRHLVGRRSARSSSSRFSDALMRFIRFICRSCGSLCPEV